MPEIVPLIDAARFAAHRKFLSLHRNFIRTQPIGKQADRLADPDQLPFWLPILEYPNQSGPRLVYADFLDERGDPLGAYLRAMAASTVVTEEDGSVIRREFGEPAFLNTTPVLLKYYGGVPAEIACSMDDWVRNGRDAVRALPTLSRVTVTDRRPNSLTKGPNFGWVFRREERNFEWYVGQHTGKDLPEPIFRAAQKILRRVGSKHKTLTDSNHLPVGLQASARKKVVDGQILEPNNEPQNFDSCSVFFAPKISAVCDDVMNELLSAACLTWAWTPVTTGRASSFTVIDDLIGDLPMTQEPPPPLDMRRYQFELDPMVRQMIARPRPFPGESS